MTHPEAWRLSGPAVAGFSWSIPSPEGGGPQFPSDAYAGWMDIHIRTHPFDHCPAPRRLSHASSTATSPRNKHSCYYRLSLQASSATRLRRPWNSPGKNTGVACHFLLQCMRSRSVMSNSSRPHGLQPTRLLRPWDFPGKSTGVECHCLLHPPALKLHLNGIMQHVLICVQPMLLNIMPVRLICRVCYFSWLYSTPPCDYVIMCLSILLLGRFQFQAVTLAALNSLDHVSW